MRALGYYLTRHHSKSLEEAECHAPFDAVVTMGCGNACPWMPAKHFYEWFIPDPRNMDPDEFNSVRDLLSRKVKQLIEDLQKTE